MTGLIFKTFFLGTFLLASVIYNTSAAADGDPKMAPVPAASAASAELEAASPTTPAASAARPAASAAAASGSAAPAAATAAAAPATAAAAPIEPAALSTKEFYGFSFATRDAAGLDFDSNMNLVPDEKIWPTRNKTKYLDSLTSEDENMFFDFGGRKDGGYEVITTNKITKRAIMTVFKDKKPVSQTIVGEHGSYTATESFCKLLKEQTKSKDFEDLKSKAAMCSDFYSRTDDAKVGMGEHIALHRANIDRMQKSPAKDIVAKERAEYLESESKKRTTVQGFKAIFKSAPSVKPRTILNRSTNTEEAQDRQAIGDMAEACGRLWSEPEPAAKPAAKPAAAPTKAVKVGK